MIYKRFAANLRAQNWTAVTIELFIVILGVFIGTWVANWNQRQTEKREVAQLIEQLRPDVDRLLAISAGQRKYYATTARYADVAFAGWAGDPKVSDRDFVIAAYQASQIVAMSSDRQNYALLLGADQVREIDDVPLRTAIVRMLNYNFEPISLPAVRTRYRDNVRQVIPEAIQQAVRDQCGDRTDHDRVTIIPPRCDIPLSPSDAAEGARQLRAHPALAGDLRLHQAQIAAFLLSIDRFENRLKAVADLIDGQSR